MKKLNIVIGIISAVLVSCCTIFPIRGNGNLVTSERGVSSFEKINLSGSAEVRFHVSEEYRAVVTVDSNLDKYTEVYTRGNVLIIGSKSGAYFFTKYLVDVYCPTLTGVSMSGSGQFSGNDTIITSTFDTNISGAGTINGTIECSAFSVKISGSGKATVIGNSEDLKIDISGSGNFNGNEFSTNNAAVLISGSGKVSICVTDDLKVDMSGSGDLNYRGDPKTDLRITGAGRIRKI